MPPALLAALPAIGAVAGGVATIGSSLLSSSAAGRAANAQTAAANTAAQTQLHMYDTTRGDLAPYRNAGQSALDKLMQALGLAQAPAPSSGVAFDDANSGQNARIWQSYLDANPDVMADYQRNSAAYGAAGGNPLEFAARHYAEHGQAEGRQLTGTPTQSDPTALGFQSMLEATPGYQFARNEGISGLDRSAASRGMLLSGGQLRDVTKFASGLAQGTWTDYVNRLAGLTNTGEGAAAQTGQFGANAATGAAGSQLAAGQSTAAGIAGQSNALTSGLQGLANNLTGSGSSYLSRTPQFSFDPIMNSSGSGFAPSSGLSTWLPATTFG